MAEPATTLRHDVGVGLISVGWMGKLHSRAYQALPYVYPETGIRPRLLHAADTAADRVSYATDVLGYARGSTDYRQVLADPEVEVVSICAPNMLHREIGLAAADAGKPFWIEKPVGRTVEETAAVAAAANAAGLVTSIGYNYRHAPAVEHSRQLVASGALGRVTNVRAVFFSGYAAEPKGALSWRFDRELAGSGALSDLLSHVVDLMQYVVGPVAEVSALTSLVYAERPILPMGSATHFTVIEDGELGPVENEDYAAALVRFAAEAQGPGAVGTLEASRTIVGLRGCIRALHAAGWTGPWGIEILSEDFRRLPVREATAAAFTTAAAQLGLADDGR
jgi:predicted dehydrogenase